MSRTTCHTLSLTSGICAPNPCYHHYLHHEPHSSSNLSLKVLLNPLRQSHRNFIFINRNRQIGSFHSLSPSSPRHLWTVTYAFRLLLHSAPISKRKLFWHVNYSSQIDRASFTNGSAIRIGYFPLHILPLPTHCTPFILIILYVTVTIYSTF